MRLVIITITYNNLNGLMKTNESLEVQSDQDYIQIVIDGGSTDGTSNYVKNMRERASFYYASERDKGIYDAMNKGLLKYKSLASNNNDYILFLNSGDYLYSKESIKNIKEKLIDLDSDLLLFDVYEDIYGKLYYKKSRDKDWIPKGMPTSHQAMLFNSNIFKEYKFDDGMRFSGDYDLVCYCYINNKNIKKTNKAVSVFDKTGVSEVNRIQALKENYVVRRKTLKMSFLNSIFLYFIHYIHTKLKIYLPGFTRYLRGLTRE
ncbi:colanic acid biosynthesis glycosyltransferase WcaE [Alteromonas sp. I4]|nr:colanic acid biosynthesis glycosyltransferase WcaE [Alteromonas sp. I4]